MSKYSTLTQSVSTVGESQLVTFQNPTDDFKMLINVIVEGTASYNLEYSIDPSLIGFIPLGEQALSVSTDESFYFPVKAVKITKISGTGTVKLVVLHTI